MTLITASMTVGWSASGAGRAQERNYCQAAAEMNVPALRPHGTTRAQNERCGTERSHLTFGHMRLYYDERSHQAVCQVPVSTGRLA